MADHCQKYIQFDLLTGGCCPPHPSLTGTQGRARHVVSWTGAGWTGDGSRFSRTGAVLPARAQHGNHPSVPRAPAALRMHKTQNVGALLLCWLLTGRPEATLQEPQPGVGRDATSCRTWRSGRGDVQTGWRAAGAPSTTIRVTASAARDPETGSNTNLSRMIFGGSKDRSTTVLARARRFTEGIFLLRV